MLPMRRRNDEGFSTITGAGVIAALASVLVGVLFVGAAVVARHRAQSAADLGALAAASAHVLGDDGCAAATELLASADGRPRIVSCTVDGQDVVLRVAVSVRLGGLGVRDAVAAARAGPVGE